MLKCCDNCRHMFVDRSVNACDCLRADDLTEEEFDRFFCEEVEGCPCWEKIEEEEFDRWLNDAHVVEK